ncbi:hypothetical protein DZB88_19830 [Bacillus sp. OE]|nr:hypothetical protein DZB88_19830 [Bacillus sp. OE]
MMEGIEPLPLLGIIQLQRLEWSVASRLPTRRKAPLHQKLQCPAILSEPLPLLDIIQLQRLESPVISLSRMKQKALQGRELQCPAILGEPLPLLNRPHQFKLFS